jgi:hypothetical protein
MRRLLAVVAFLAGCSADPLYVYSPAAWNADRWDAIDDAGALLGRELVPIDRRYGAVEIVWWYGGPCADSEDAWGCAETRQRGCKRNVRSVANGMALAHEIGHAFGLDHNDVRGDLMFSQSGRETFIEQHLFDRRADRFGLCRVEH